MHDRDKAIAEIRQYQKERRASRRQSHWQSFKEGAAAFGTISAAIGVIFGAGVLIVAGCALVALSAVARLLIFPAIVLLIVGIALRLMEIL